MSYPTLNFGLGETIDMLRDSVHQFAQAELAPRAAQIDRIAARDGSGRELAEAMVSAQLDGAGRLPMADDVLINDGPLADLQDWSRHLYARYAALAQA